MHYFDVILLSDVIWAFVPKVLETLTKPFLYLYNVLNLVASVAYNITYTWITFHIDTYSRIINITKSVNYFCCL